MTKNKLSDLNNHLFEQLERLNDDELSNEKLDKEIARAKAMKGISEQIIANANTVLRAEQILDELNNGKPRPPMLEG